MIKTENLLKDLFENPKNIVLVTDENFIIRYVSDSVQSILGVSAFSLLGRNAATFVRPENQDILTHHNPDKPREISFKNSNGKKIYFDVTVTNHVANESIKGIVIFLYDVTQRKIAQQELESENNHLDHFIYKTTHDLRAPLHSALGLINLAQQAPPEERDEYIRLIRKSLLKLDGLIEEVNNFYRNDKLAVAKEKFNLEEIIKAEFETLKDLPEATGIRFDVRIMGDAMMCSDRIRVKTILSNILSNSIKYSDKKKNNRFILFDAHVTPAEVRIKISDNGIGIETDNLEKIFDIFFRVNHASSGTGLGLHIVKDTVQRLNGTIRVESTLGVGTSFLLTIPNCVSEPVREN